MEDCIDAGDLVGYGFEEICQVLEFLVMFFFLTLSPKSKGFALDGFESTTLGYRQPYERRLHTLSIHAVDICCRCEGPLEHAGRLLPTRVRTMQNILDWTARNAKIFCTFDDLDQNLLCIKKFLLVPASEGRQSKISCISTSSIKMSCI